MKTVFEKSVKGRLGNITKKPEKTAKDLLPESLLRQNKARLPELSELDVMRHFTELSRLNFSVDNNFYPLGSCTMKYNPRFADLASSLPGFANIHPFAAEFESSAPFTQGALEAVWTLETLLNELTGMKAFSLQPMAGAQGELTGIMLIAAYHRHKGNKKTKVICPDSAHGTNPATAALAGYEVVNIPSKDGIIDPSILATVLDDDVAALMMTCPNTLGLFEKNLPEIVELLRSKDALLYYDGANFNAIMGKMRVGDAGFDVVHLNLHKTMGTPHGGGGPGAGPVGVIEKLIPFLPTPRVQKTKDNHFYLEQTSELSIGKVAPFHGNFAVCLRALAYILRLGKEGLTRASEYAVLNANYLRVALEKVLEIPYNRICMHEFVASAVNYKDVKALDIAKAMLDQNIHAPTIYFPLIVKECMMFEPTETESKDTLDRLIQVLSDIAVIAEKNPQQLHDAPQNLPRKRMDETKAARDMVLTYEL
ncbi:aminomethyl-transferring glycine dehydrogenase subunit GcvPB [Desulfovibrio litoralis]|uniref:glycine dehydrogenase (aminomethyl-transferring) n=1 Tax=Desulfovibrio litoralis DSM 11393 TaxID=1121455 RepID=A0A1M7TK82_9BACT|nr:aminomethyl-transferring glycine dehydrogenase subunit GcvPB [Desulfovibrio litoralis]SHN71131.1 glycine dehydrogenase (decarboxylating) beta subunit [Desulfovibrio litoralis DSM 11393]